MHITTHDAGDDDREVRLTFRFERDELRLVTTPIGVVAHLEGFGTSGEPGAPALPRTRVRIAVPEPLWPHELSIEKSEHVVLTDGPVLVAPAQRLQPGATRRRGGDADRDADRDDADREDGDEQAKRDGTRRHGEGCDCCGRREWYPRVSDPYPAPEFTPPDPDKYEAAGRDPQPVAIAVGVETVGRTHVAVVELMPLRLDSQGQLELCTHLELRVVCSSRPPVGDRDAAIKTLTERLGRDIDPARVVVRPEPVIRSLTEAERLREILLTEVINPEIVKIVDRQWPWYELPADYVIVTDDFRWDAATITRGVAVPGMVDQFHRLARWKRSRGVSAKVVTITDIVAGRYGDHRTGARDLQEVIRRFLQHARNDWGTTWLLLGGDLSVVPIRSVAGAMEGGIALGTKTTPDDNTSFWTGSFLKMHVVNPGIWWGASANNRLVRSDTGALIPYDPTGASSATQAGWYFTTDDTYTTRTTMATNFVRVNGPGALANGAMQFLYTWNTIPTDFYYASLNSWVVVQTTTDFGWFSFTVPHVFFPEHDWDALDNGLYGQHLVNGTDLDGVIVATDLSVGRAPVENAVEATTFVDKVIGYEQFGSGVYIPVDGDWPRRMVIASSDWGGPSAFTATPNNPPAAGQYHHDAGNARSVLALDKPPAKFEWDLITEISDTDRRVLPYTGDPNPAVRGWYFARSATDMAVNGVTFSIFGVTFTVPLPGKWIVVHGSLAERTPQQYLLDWYDQDSSMADQERLREQIRAELPGIDTFDRLYEDELDLTPGQRWAAPVQHLTSARFDASLNAGPHFMSLSGHGSGDGCCGGSVWSAGMLTNGLPGFIGYADSCLTNQVDMDDAFSEALLKNPNGGAVAYVGNTRFSWINVGDDFQRAFFHRLTATRHLGLLNDSKCSVYGTTGFRTGYDRWVIFALNLLGDPEMRVYRHAVPGLGVRVKNPRFELPIEIYVEVNRPPRPPIPDPAPDALVVIRQGDLELVRRADAFGVVRVEAGLLGHGPVEVTASHPDTSASLVTFELPEPQWLTGRVMMVSHRDGGRRDAVVVLLVDDAERGVVVAADHADYRVILDALENALISGSPISVLIVRDGDDDVIDRFRLRAEPTPT